MGFYTPISYGSVDKGYVRLIISMPTNHNFVIDARVSGTPMNLEKEPLGVILGYGNGGVSGKYYCGSGKIYWKGIENGLDVIIAADSSVDYSVGFVFGAAKCSYAAVINRSNFDLSDYTEIS